MGNGQAVMITGVPSVLPPELLFNAFSFFAFLVSCSTKPGDGKGLKQALSFLTEVFPIQQPELMLVVGI